MSDPLPGLPTPPPRRLVASVYVQFFVEGDELKAQPLSFVPDVAAPFVARSLEQLAAALKRAPRSNLVVVPASALPPAPPGE